MRIRMRIKLAKFQISGNFANFKITNKTRKKTRSPNEGHFAVPQSHDQTFAELECANQNARIKFAKFQNQTTPNFKSARERIKGHFAVPQSHERKKSPGIGISNFRRIRMRELECAN